MKGNVETDGCGLVVAALFLLFAYNSSQLRRYGMSYREFRAYRRDSRRPTQQRIKVGRC